MCGRAFTIENNTTKTTTTVIAVTRENISKLCPSTKSWCCILIRVFPEPFTTRTNARTHALTHSHIHLHTKNDEIYEKSSNRKAWSAYTANAYLFINLTIFEYIQATRNGTKCRICETIGKVNVLVLCYAMLLTYRPFLFNITILVAIFIYCAMHLGQISVDLSTVRRIKTDTNQLDSNSHSLCMCMYMFGLQIIIMMVMLSWALYRLVCIYMLCVHAMHTSSYAVVS